VKNTLNSCVARFGYPAAGDSFPYKKDTEVFMKKGLIVGLALLVAFAMTGLAGCKNEPDSPTKYTVKYSRGEVPSSVTLTIPGDVKIEKGKKLTAAQLVSPGTWTDYIWDGWYNGTTMWTTAMPVNANMTLVAKYTLDPATTVWTVKFNLNGGTGGPFPDIQVDREPAGPLGDAFPDTEPTRENFTFKGWFDSEGEEYTADEPDITASVTLIAKWEFAPSANFFADAEKVSLKNSWFVVYEFKLPNTKQWSDYTGKIEVEYLVADQDLIDSGMARAVRLMGNYKVTDFLYFTGTQTGTAAGKNVAVASYNHAKNNPYIINNLGGGWSDGNFSSTISGLTGAEPEVGKWFTLTYNTNTTRSGSAGPDNAHNDFADANKPTGTGPFYFGFGLPGQDDVNTFYIRKVTLPGYEGTDDLIAKPFKLVDKDDSEEYDVFTGYNTPDGSNGYAEAKRESAIETGAGSITYSKVDRVPLIFDIDFDYNYLTAMTTGATGATQPADVKLTTDKNGLLDGDEVAALGTGEKVYNGTQMYRFLGWFTSATPAASDTARALNGMFTAAVKLYGKWEAYTPADPQVIDLTGQTIKNTAKPGSWGNIFVLTTGTAGVDISKYNRYTVVFKMFKEDGTEIDPTDYPANNSYAAGPPEVFNAGLGSTVQMKFFPSVVDSAGATTTPAEIAKYNMGDQYDGGSGASATVNPSAFLSGVKQNMPPFPNWTAATHKIMTIGFQRGGASANPDFAFLEIISITFTDE
jgi:uncharacterized repeat protein (TIGR02543 family)